MWSLGIVRPASNWIADMEISIDRLKKESLSETIAEELFRLIAAGTLKSGQRLNEVHLSESFGVSRGPIREAARELEGQGLIISRPRQGFYVANFTAAQLTDLYEVVRWVDPAIIHDFQTYSDPQSCRDILADIDNIGLGSKLDLANSLLAFRERLAGRIHNRFLAAQALALFRQFHIISALIGASGSEAWMNRIILLQRETWTAMAGQDWDRARALGLAAAEDWRKDVTPQFAG